MRDIEFRVWDAKRKKMVEWGHLVGFCDISYLVDYQSGDELYHNIPMQYTGLKDCNGVKIFEGDLLHSLDPVGFSPKTVSFADGSFVIDYGKRWQISLHQEYIEKNELVLIGNIHQHPHLLEGKE